MSEIEPFELFALRYGTHGGRTDAMNFLGGDLHDQGEDLDYFVWVARRSDRVVLIDTGFSPTVAATRGRSLIRAPSEALMAMGIAGGRVDDVVLTHLHFDHAGTIGDYPNARFHLQDCEMAFATGRCMCHPHLNHPFEIEDVVAMVRMVHAGRVSFHDGDSELTPGLTLHKIGGHSAGLQAVRVYTRRGWVVIASDASHLYANMETGRPFPILVSTAEMLEGFQTLYRLADSVDHVIPGHDPQVMARYPALSPDFADVVVRLDMAPSDVAR